LRDAAEFLNVTLAEQPNGDFGRTIVRQFLIASYQRELYEALQTSSDARLAQIAAKALKETRYHVRYSASWLVRLGDGTPESHARVQAALDELWPFTAELFAEDEVDAAMQAARIAPEMAALQARWSKRIDEVLAEAKLRRPADSVFPWHGRRGVHTEHLGFMLAEMQFLQRAYPGAEW
jgi:ring-1,2-phenylacetyl-CoA epoxidase subunit PaaC